VCPKHDELLFAWVLAQSRKNVAISDEIIVEHARVLAGKMAEIQPDLEFPEFKGGWISSFKTRHGIRSVKRHGEAASVDIEALKDSWPSLVTEINKYNPENIYNLDETGLFFQLAPTKTIAQRQVEGSKKVKTRLSIAFCSNATGTDKLEPIIIGKAEKPRCFKKKTASELGFQYYHNAKAWMTGVIFTSVLQKMNAYFKKNNKKALLLIDNAACHILPEQQLEYLHVKFLPPNTTAYIQPMDQGIISAFKARFKKRQLALAIDKINCDVPADLIYKVDQLTAMNWVKQEWKNLSSITIVNCWRHSQLLVNMKANTTNPVAIQSEEIDEITSMISKLVTDAEHRPSAQEFIDSEKHSATEEDFNEDEAIKESLAPEEHLEQEEEETSPEVSLDQKIRSLRFVSTWMESHGDLEDLLLKIRSLAKELNKEHVQSLQQSQITSFFSTRN
jgi:hypothetical protein